MGLDDESKIPNVRALHMSERSIGQVQLLGIFPVRVLSKCRWPMGHKPNRWIMFYSAAYRCGTKLWLLYARWELMHSDTGRI